MNRPRLLKTIVPVIVLALAGLVMLVLVLTQPQPSQRRDRPPGTLVQTRTFEPTEQRFVVSASGRVRAAVQTALLPQVTGRVVAVNPSLVPGGRIAAGEKLLQLDRSDFELRVRRERTNLQQARAQYQLELGRQRVAQRDWELFADELDPDERDPSLALREPQLQSAKARVAAAQAALAEAQLALERTSIAAPFDAVVLSEEVDLGQLVSPQSPVAQLVGTERLWVEASIQADRLPFIDIAPKRGSIARVRQDTGDLTVERRGRLTRLLPDLSETGRMARVLIEIADPWTSTTLPSSDPPLLLNAWVDITIEGNRKLSGIQLPRSYVHGANEVWIYEDGRLDVRPVRIAWETPERVFVIENLTAQDRVITTPIAAPVDGMELRTAQREAARRVAEGDPAGSGMREGGRR